MPRSIWSGAISFGLVNIPIKLYSAMSPKDIHFHMLHDEDGVRVQQKRICPKDGKEIPYEHIAKGYEVSPNHYVMIKPEELTALDPKAVRTIEIESFVDLNQVDPIYYENSYYLVPDKGAGKAYALLMAAMTDTKKVGIAKFVMRTKQYLVLLRPAGRALTLSTLYYADEVVNQDVLEELNQDEVKINDKELAMARQLVGSLANKFEPEKYHDEYRERVLELIEKKSQGQTIPSQPEFKSPTNVVNLMEALEASLAAAKKQSSSSSDSSGSASASAKKTAPAKKAAAHTHRKRKTA